MKRPFVWISLILLAGFVLAALVLDFDPAAVADWFESLGNSPLAIPAVLLIYCLGAFVSAPQWMLHAGVVLTFGPVYGSVIAWLATMLSAALDFWIGRHLGAHRVEKMGGKLVRRLVSIVRKHGFWTSLAVRIVPTGPFIIVNMAAGVAGMTFAAFMAGTAIGILPKIITVAFFGEGVQGAADGKGLLYIGIVVAIAFIWMAIIAIASARLRPKTMTDEDKTAN